MLQQADARRHAHPRRTACAVTSSPTSTRCTGKSPVMPIELDPFTYGLTIWDLEPAVPHRRDRRHGEDGARRPARRAARRLLPHDRRRVHAHPGHRGAALDPVQGRGSRTQPFDQGRASTASSSGSTPPRRSRSSSPPSTSAPSGSGSRASESAIPILDEILSAAADAGLAVVASSAWPTAAASTCCRTSSARATTRSSASSRGTSTRLGAGLGRRQVPPRRHRQVRQPVGCRHPARAGRQPEPPRDGRPDRRGDGARRPGPHRAAGLVPGAAAADPRRRRLRRPGRGGRDAGDERHHRATASAAPST